MKFLLHQVLINLLYLFFLIVSSKVIAFNDNQFWITGEVKNVEWKKNCLTIDRCLQPRFQIAFFVSDNSIASRVDSPIIERLSIKNKMPINAFFENASPNDLSTTASVFGVDSLFNVPVICDKSNYIQLFQSFTMDSETIDVVLEGNCFRAFLEIGKHQQKCPWCSEEKSSSKNNNESYLFDFLLLSPNQRVYTIILLVIVLIFLILAVILTFLLVKQKSSNSEGFSRYPYTNTTTRSTITTGTPTSESSDVTNGIFYDIENLQIKGQRFTDLNVSNSVRPPPVSTIPSVRTIDSEYHEYSSITPIDFQQSKSSFLNSWKINRQSKQKNFIPQGYGYI
uniref:Bis(5'-nucleosyl)-tetraphosphatase [asymmetrical] n=1 Tax=Strongyloides stercoralis TaxID=6248 RepID=A0A0K0DTL3_STRER